MSATITIETETLLIAVLRQHGNQKGEKIDNRKRSRSGSFSDVCNSHCFHRHAIECDGTDDPTRQFRLMEITVIPDGGSGHKPVPFTEGEALSTLIQIPICYRNGTRVRNRGHEFGVTFVHFLSSGGVPPTGKSGR